MDNLTTKQVFAPNGRYTEERLAVHEAIIADAIRGHSPAPDQANATYMGGGSASGKSTLRDKLIERYAQDNLQIVVIDPDAIKKLLPEHAELVIKDAETAADVLHDESSDIGEKLYSKCLENKLDFVYDSTMKNLEKYEKLIDQAQERGYKTTAIIADVPLEEALRREHARSLVEKRKVPQEIVEESHAKVPLVVKQITPKLDNVTMFDTMKTDPEIFFNKINGQIRLSNEERLAQFYDKALAIESSRSNWIKLENPMLLKDVLKLAKGAATGSQLNDQVLNQKVRQYQFGTDANGKEKLDYRVDGTNQARSMTLSRVPHLTEERRNTMLDQASGGNGLSDAMRTKDKER